MPRLTTVLRDLFVLPTAAMAVVQIVQMIQGPVGDPPSAAWLPYMFAVYLHLLILPLWLVVWPATRGSTAWHLGFGLAFLGVLAGACAVDYAWYDGGMETNVALAVIPGIGVAALMVGAIVAALWVWVRRRVRRRGD